MIRTIKIILPAVVALFLSGCKKDHSVLGVDVQPGEDGLNAESVRGLPVYAHTVAYDSIICYNDVTYAFLGNNTDPIFGKTDIGLYLNTSISVSNLDFGATSTLTAAEMILALDNTVFTGDKNAVLTYSIFPLDSTLDGSGKRYYYSTNKRLYNPTPIVVQSTIFDTINGQSVIKINLDKTYAENLMRDTPNLTTNEVFQAKYKGYYIAASIKTPGAEGVVFRVNLSSELSGLHLHYLQSAAPNDTLDFRFPVNAASAVHFNTVKFEPATEIKNQFQDSTLGNNRLFLKGMGMSKLKIQIPFLKDYSDSFDVAVNRAELILTLEPGSMGSGGAYTPPPALTLLSIDSLGRETFIADLLTATDFSRYDGLYDDTYQRYVFNIAREAQLIFRGQKKNNGFYLVVANSIPGLSREYVGTSRELKALRRDTYIQRVVLAGNNNVAYKPVFNINYIKFKND